VVEMFNKANKAQCGVCGKNSASPLTKPVTDGNGKILFYLTICKECFEESKTKGITCKTVEKEDV
jgi:hypothetical protein